MVAFRPGPAAFRTMPLIARLGLILLSELVTLGVVAIYIAAVTLLMQRRLPRRLLMIVAPVGRMPLTTYLSQSLIATFIFYGWGLGWIGEVSIGEGVAIAAGIYAVQVVIANVWLRRFRSGPLEWLWRGLTYRPARARRRRRRAGGALGGVTPRPRRLGVTAPGMSARIAGHARSCPGLRGAAASPRRGRPPATRPVPRPADPREP